MLLCYATTTIAISVITSVSSSSESAHLGFFSHAQLFLVAFRRRLQYLSVHHFIRVCSNSHSSPSTSLVMTFSQSSAICPDSACSSAKGGKSIVAFTTLRRSRSGCKISSRSVAYGRSAFEFIGILYVRPHALSRPFIGVDKFLLELQGMVGIHQGIEGVDVTAVLIICRSQECDDISRMRGAVLLSTLL